MCLGALHFLIGFYGLQIFDSSYEEFQVLPHYSWIYAKFLVLLESSATIIVENSNFLCNETSPCELDIDDPEDEALLQQSRRGWFLIKHEGLLVKNVYISNCGAAGNSDYGKIFFKIKFFSGGGTFQLMVTTYEGKDSIFEGKELLCFLKTETQLRKPRSSISSWWSVFCI